MANRKRKIVLRCPVTDEEKALIYEKMALLKTTQTGAYLRKMAIDGYIIQIDHSAIKENTAELQKIGVNINQIARRFNATGAAYAEDIAEIKEMMDRPEDKGVYRGIPVRIMGAFHEPPHPYISF